MKKFLTASLLLLSLTACGAPPDSSNQDDTSENTESKSEFHAEEVELPDGTSVVCVAYRDNFVCDWR